MPTDGIAATELRWVFLATLLHEGIHGVGDLLKLSFTHLNGVKRSKAGALVRLCTTSIIYRFRRSFAEPTGGTRY